MEKLRNSSDIEIGENQKKLNQPLFQNNSNINTEEQEIMEKRVQKQSIALSVDQNQTSDLVIQDDSVQLGGQKKHSFYLFINPSSGNNDGKLFLDLEKNFYECEIENKKQYKSQLNFNELIKSYEVYFQFINLADSQSREQGVKHLKQTLEEQQSTVSAITCGGDGTVMWTTEVLVNAEINLDYVPMGIIALGTGNDFSRALGWGPSSDIEGLIKNEFKKLKILALSWIQGQVCDFDIWDVQCEAMQEGGSFSVIKRKENGDPYEQIIQNSEKNGPALVLNKTFCNYFSVGVDARIGIEFDKKRTKSRLGNLCVYCCESVMRMFKKKPRMGHTMQELIEDKNQLKNESEVIFRTRTGLDYKQDKKSLKEIKKNDENEYNKQIQMNERFLKGSPNCILLQNINSYGGGTSGIWSGASKLGGIINQNNTKKLKQNAQFVKQQFSDGKIEIVSFNKMIQMGVERMVNGMADRIAQGEGPYIFNFRQSDQKGQLIRTYFQVDGEFYIVNGPQRMVIRKSEKLPQGRFKVIVQQKMYEKICSQKE